MICNVRLNASSLTGDEASQENIKYCIEAKINLFSD